MTAGHCSDSGPFNSDGSVSFFHLPWGGIVGRRLIGPMARPDMSVADMGFISKRNPDIGVIPSIRNTDDQEFPELIIYGTLDSDTVGSTVCKSGYTTHVTCGEILAFGVTVTFLNGMEFNGLIKATHMSCGGDSGAPVFQFAEDILPGIFITGMVTGGSEEQGVCVIEPIAKLITDDIYVLTINDPI
ncbi:trypsin-like cysteine/serine peptidase domain-containing protein [Gigaspora rosea]|uniref:Trypsin-like cysteine/serine peptidase domain-containing protein n=1 Tax=Gigaspora rosea TaxID=44941 RepID=A0A397VYS2_9GLOM|nr:trypsin-like cysteine/serine peptidase domain-containing protein [Gigaspora rosea]